MEPISLTVVEEGETYTLFFFNFDPVHFGGGGYHELLPPEGRGTVPLTRTLDDVASLL